MDIKNALDDLVSLMYVNKIDVNTYEGSSLDIGTGRVYGGQVLGQALKSAQSTVDRLKNVHSMHAYFMREGNHDIPITYHVDISRDGRSFSTRRVVAVQESRPIFISDMSFQVSESGPEYQPGLPAVSPPAALKSLQEYATGNDGDQPDSLAKLIRLSSPFEIKPVMTPQERSVSSTWKYTWIRTIHEIPGDPDIHRALLAYLSDYGLMTTALLPHGLDFDSPGLQLASIDHSMWFHRDARVDRWLLYACEPLSTGNARGLSRGSIYTEDGSLVATTAQEGLIRQIK